MSQRMLDRLATVAVLAGLILITYLTLSRPGSLPVVAGGDKLHHALAFAALVFLPVMAWPARALSIVLVAIAYGGLIEIVQPYFGRSGEWADLGADVVGALVGAGAALLGRRLVVRP